MYYQIYYRCVQHMEKTLSVLGQNCHFGKKVYRSQNTQKTSAASLFSRTQGSGLPTHIKILLHWLTSINIPYWYYTYIYIVYMDVYIYIWIRFYIYTDWCSRASFRTRPLCGPPRPRRPCTWGGAWARPMAWAWVNANRKNRQNIAKI